MRILVNIDVDDIERAVDFYHRALGLRPGRRLFNGTVAEMTGASSTIYLIAGPPGSAPIPGKPAVRRYERHWTPVHLDFEVDDVPAAVERAVAAGGVLERDVQTLEWGELAALSDPFGHGFCVLKLNDRGYDAVARPGGG